MTNYFELFAKQLDAIEKKQDTILARLSTTTPTQDEIGGIELARQITRLSAARIYTLVSERKIPHSKRGNRLTFRRSELLKYLIEGNREAIGGLDA